MKKALSTMTLLLLLSASLWAVGKFDLYAPAARVNAAHLTFARSFLLPEARGPHKSIHVRYQDVYQGKRRTWFYSAQSYTDPDGSLAYAVVVSEQTGKTSKRHMAFGSVSPIPPESGEETPDHAVVYEGLAGYLKSIQVEKRLKP